MQHCERRSVELYFASAIWNARHAECPATETFVINNESSAVPGQNFHAVRSSADEYEKVPCVEVMRAESTHQRGEPVMPTAQIDGLGGSLERHQRNVDNFTP